MYVILNKKLVLARKAVISISDHGFKFGDAIFETIRTIDGKPWLLGEHLKRLRASAKVLGLKVPYTNAEFAKQIERLIFNNKYAESRVRITLTRGNNGFDFLTCKKPLVLIEATKLSKFKQFEGISVTTFEVERPASSIKSTSMLPSILARRNPGEETLLVDRHGNITEGSFSNIFVVKGDLITTPKEGMLEGTTRNFILAKYSKTKEAPIPLKNIHKYDEIFLTSSTKGVIPVIKVDGKPINNGKIGELTKQIIKLLPYGTKK